MTAAYFFIGKKINIHSLLSDKDASSMAKCRVRRKPLCKNGGRDCMKCFDRFRKKRKRRCGRFSLKVKLLKDRPERLCFSEVVRIMEQGGSRLSMDAVFEN